MEQQSVLIHENELFLFDSHARNEEGLLSPDVLLYLSKFSTVEDLVTHIDNLYACGRPKILKSRYADVTFMQSKTS